MLRVGADTAEVRLVVTRGPHIVGRVVGPDGAPLPRFRVSTQSLGDANGAFALPIPPAQGSEPLVFEAEGVATRVLWVEPRVGGGDVDVGVVRMNRGHRLQGRVVDAETGEPVMHAHLQLAPRASPAGRGPFTLHAQLTEGDGTFELRHVDLEAFTVTVTHHAYQPQHLTGGPGQEALTVRLRPGARAGVAE